MKVDPERFLLFAAALAGCHEAARQPPAEAPPTVTPAVATIEVPPVPPTPDTGPPAANSCEALALQNDAVVARVGGACAGYEADEPSVRAELAKTLKDGFFRYCHQGKGTWAVVVLSATVDAPSGESGGCGWSADYQIVFQADPRAKIADGIRTKSTTWDAFPDDTTSATNETTVDYDGDGRDELILALSDWQNGGGGTTNVAVLQSDGRKIVPYKVPSDYDAMVDADGDGRPDLVDSNYFHAPTYCGLSPRDELGASVLLHSLPDGTFSRTDDVARRWAVTQCPSPDAGASDCTLGASCRRFWGRSTKEVTAWMASSPVCRETETCSGPSGAPGASVGATPERIKGIATPAPPFVPLNRATPQPFPSSNREEPKGT